MESVTSSPAVCLLMTSSGQDGGTVLFWSDVKLVWLTVRIKSIRLNRNSGDRNETRFNLRLICEFTGLLFLLTLLFLLLKKLSGKQLN